jgi:polysaccharide biosynthesis protein PslH
MKPAKPMGEILMLVHRIPWPADRGDKIRSYNALRRIAELAPVHVGCFAEDERDESFAAAMAEVTRSQCVVRRLRSRASAGLRALARHQPVSLPLFDAHAIHEFVRRTLAERPISAVFVYSGQMAQFVPVLPAGVRFIMDFVDIDSAKFASYGANTGGLMGWVHRREARLLAAFEQAVAQRADLSLFVSEAEAALFREQAALPADRVKALDNGVDTAFFDPAAPFEPLRPCERGEGPLIVFTGQMDYRPNVEAVCAFAAESLPAIRARYRKARFAIVGRSPAAAVRALNGQPGIIVTGAVDDVRGWIAAADVVVAPLRIARGIQNKVLEAMAMARPVVASGPAAEGIDAEHDQHFIVAAPGSTESHAVLSLLDNPAGAAAFGARARARVLARYSWASAMSGLPEMLFGPAHSLAGAGEP